LVALERSAHRGRISEGADGYGSAELIRRMTMPSAREIMTTEAEWVEADATAAEVARKLANTDLGALPVCDGQGHLQGIVTDRDLVVKVMARGRDPESVKVADLADQPEVVTIGADDAAEEAIATMKRYGVRRLPVIDGNLLVGMISQADIARSLPDSKVGDVVGAISEAPPNN
jgi:CBS domain-containing protein